MSDYDAAVAASMTPDPAQSARIGFSIAADTNPDAYAEARRVARSTGVPVDTVQALPAEMKKQARLGEIDFGALSKTNPATAKLLGDIEQAKIAHDDIDNLTGIESLIYNVGKFTVGTARSVASAVPKFNEGAWGVARAGADLLPDSVGKPLAESFARMGGSQRRMADSLVPKSANIIESSWYSGMQSLGLNALLTPFALAANGMRSILWGMGLTTGGSAYGEARDKGLPVLPSVAFGTLQGVIEARTEMIGMPALFSLLKPGSFGKKALEYLVKDQGGEQIATHLQDLNEWVALNPDKSVGDYLAERPAAAVQTALATAFGGGGQVALMKGLEIMATRGGIMVENSNAAQDLLGRLNEMSAASKLLARDNASFSQWVADAAENGPVNAVFIDARALQQSGVAEQLAQLSPSAAAQFSDALETGGYLQIPLEEYAAAVAPTELAQPLMDHLKFDPEGFSKAEAEEYMQNKAPDLQAEVERVLSEKADDEAFKASAEVVRAEIKAQLDTAARFTPQVNDAYSAMVGNFYAVQAARLGSTPEALYQRYPLNIGAERIDGPQFEQALATQPPKGWKHVVETDAAVGMWNGTSDSSAIFWTGIKSAPAFDGFSHSFDRDAVTHIRKRHGDQAAEKRKKQMAVSEVDVARIPEIVSAYDTIRTDLVSRTGSQQVAYAKRFDDGVVLYIEDVSQKRKNLRGVTMWKYPPSVDEQRILESTTSGQTSVTNGGVDGSIDRGGPEFNQSARGSFNPESLSITLLKNADLSTFLHESAHFFIEVQADLAAQLQQDASIHGTDTLSDGERQTLADTQALLDWFGIKSLEEWGNLDFEEKRSYHEQFARGFESYLFEGKAPSIELHSLFQRFRAWMVSIYRELKALNVELTDDVRSVFDRMLATTEQIQLAEQGRSMLPLFESADQAGMSIEDFARYQSLGVDATNAAIEELQARGLRDMQWIRNARGRLIKKLQKESAERRAEVRMDARREIMSQPIYRAWDFLTRKVQADDAIVPEQRIKSNPDSVDETRDSLFVAIAKLGGLNKNEVVSTWGTDPAEKPQSGVFGKPLWRQEGGLSIDGMAEALAQYGYLTPDEAGKVDLSVFERMFDAELRGHDQYSSAYDPSPNAEPAAGRDLANPSALMAGRLDRASVDGMNLPPEVVARLDDFRMIKRDALHPDIVAEMFGFSSGDELVRTLAVTEKPNDAIEGLTDQRMLEQYGDLSSPQEIERAADRAIHNDVRARLVATEANALANATGKPRILATAAKEYAAAMIARLKVRALKPGQYATAEARAGRASAKASKAGNLETAAAEKRNQLIQNYATRAAYDAQEEIDKALRYLKKFEGSSKTLDPEYAEQIDSLLARFDLRQKSNARVDKMTALAQWVDAQREQGLEPDIPPDLLNEAYRKSYKDMTVEEFRGLVDSVKQIEHLGRLKHKLLTAKNQRAYEAVRDEITASIIENGQGREADTRTPTTNMGRALQGLKRFWSSHIKAATWARVMDGGKDGGPMWEYFVRVANERGDMETTMRAQATEALTRIMAPVFKQGKMGGKGQFFPSIHRSLNREARIALALNVGNEGNLQRLLGGEGWTVAQIMPVLQSLTPEEKAAVQAVWDHFETYRPEIAAKQKRIYGKEPDWITPGSTVTAALGLRGGYYPIKYDPAASQRAEEHSDAEGAKRQLQGAYTTATTRRSFTKARAEEVSGRPLLYTLSGLYSGVNDVIHDLAWHEWLIDTNRLLRSQSIDSAIRTTYGPEAKQQFKTWAQDIAEGDKGADNAVDIALSRLRQGVSVSGLGFNVMSAAMQPLGITQSIVRVGAPWVARGIAKYIAHPIRSAREANTKSSFMENRARTRFRELNELRNQVQDHNAAKEWIGHYAYLLMMRFQQAVDVPTWHGAYEKAIAEGNDEDRAIGLADQAVIDAQGGGQTKDLAAIERGGPAQKLFTVFYSFMNTALNIGVGQTMTADTPARKAKLAADYALLYVVPAVLGFMLKNALTPGDSGDDDLDKLARKMAAAQIDYLMGLMVVVREFSDAAKTIAGANDFGRDYTGPAGLRLVSDTGSLAKQAAQGEFDDAFRKAMINVTGGLFGLPSAQINRTITGAKALAEGETGNPGALVFGFQKPR